MSSEDRGYVDPITQAKQEREAQADFNRRRAQMVREESERPSSADQYQAFVDKIDPRILEKVGRIVAQKREALAMSDRISDELLQAHNMRRQIKADADLSIKQSPRDRESIAQKANTQLKLLEGRIDSLTAQRDSHAERRSSSLRVAENVMRALSQKFGGGVYLGQLIEAMGWE